MNSTAQSLHTSTLIHAIKPFEVNLVKVYVRLSYKFRHTSDDMDVLFVKKDTNKQDHSVSIIQLMDVV